VQDDAGTFATRFDRRVVVLEPGASRPTHDAEWRDALVMITCGDVDLECSAGGRRRFAAGAVLWLAGIDIRVLHNVGVDPVVLVAVSRSSRAHDPP
jgi:quercetin dioxygenase-like cupin family protein